MKDEDFADGIYWILDAINFVKGGGYDVSTGIDYRNDVFEAWGFWAHSECTCTYEARERDWDKQNPHSQDCYQSVIRSLGFAYSWDSENEYDEQQRINEEAISQVCELLGIDPSASGSHVHCTCGRSGRYQEWLKNATHDDTCAIRDYGFKHFVSGLEVSWYKRVGRSTKSNKSMKTLDWYRIVVECLESVRDGTE